MSQHWSSEALGAREDLLNLHHARLDSGLRVCLHVDRTLTYRDCMTITTCDYCEAISYTQAGATPLLSGSTLYRV